MTCAEFTDTNTAAVHVCRASTSSEESVLRRGIYAVGEVEVRGWL